MSQRTTSEICPGCGSPATVTWLGIAAYGHNQPDREIPVSLDCSRRCSLLSGELTDHFPPKVRVPG
jgi:hypothetical protein